MRSKKDIEIKHQYLQTLKKEFNEGKIKREELYKYILSEIKSVEQDDSFETYFKNIFKKK